MGKQTKGSGVMGMPASCPGGTAAARRIAVKYAKCRDVRCNNRTTNFTCSFPGIACDDLPGRVKLLSAAGSKKVFLLFLSGEWRVIIM